MTSFYRGKLLKGIRNGSSAPASLLAVESWDQTPRDVFLPFLHTPSNVVRYSYLLGMGGSSQMHEGTAPFPPGSTNPPLPSCERGGAMV